MARPNNATAIAGHIQGLKEAKAAFQALEPTFREYMADATEITVKETARAAQNRLQSSPSIQTRNLYNAVDWTMNRNNGRGRAGVKSGTTTFVSAGRKIKIKGIYKQNAAGAWSKKDQPSRRAHFIEFGTKTMPAEPFMVPALESQKGPYLERVRAAGKKAERDLTSGRFG